MNEPANIPVDILCGGPGTRIRARMVTRRDCGPLTKPVESDRPRRLQ